MKIVYIDSLENVTEEILEMLRQEPTCYFSVNKECDTKFLFTDDEKYKQISDKLDFEYDTSRKGDTLEEYIEWNYEQVYLEYEKTYLDYIKVSIPYHDYYEGTVETIEYMIKENEFDFSKWDKEIERYLKSVISIVVGSKLEDELVKIKDDGFDLGVINNVINRVIKRK